MSPELETLDQLLGGEMPLLVIRGLYRDDARFVAGLSGMLHAGEVRLVNQDGEEVPGHRWREALADPGVCASLRVDITEAGARRVQWGGNAEPSDAAASP
jgi:hypothetical protein